jgi:hypothetical protein
LAVQFRILGIPLASSSPALAFLACLAVSSPDSLGNSGFSSRLGVLGVLGGQVPDSPYSLGLFFSGLGVLGVLGGSIPASGFLAPWRFNSGFVKIPGGNALRKSLLRMNEQNIRINK